MQICTIASYPGHPMFFNGVRKKWGFFTCNVEKHGMAWVQG